MLTGHILEYNDRAQPLVEKLSCGNPKRLFTALAAFTPGTANTLPQQT
jgi:hypothetical protein